MRPHIIHCPIHGPVFGTPHYNLLEGGETVYSCPQCDKIALKAIKANPREVEIKDLPQGIVYRRPL